MTHSKRWLEEHEKDSYVKRAKKEGYPSRAAYKLLEIYRKYKLFKPSMSVIDLGAAPGGCSQVAKDLVSPKGVVIAVDLLPMQSMSDVIFIQGNFNEPEIFNQLESIVAKKTLTGQVDLVISDMTHNISGIKNVDQSRSLHLVELAWDCAQNY